MPNHATAIDVDPDPLYRRLLDLDPQDIFKSNFHPLIINLKVQVPTGSFR